jgi:hypothetical protein
VEKASRLHVEPPTEFGSRAGLNPPGLH